MPSFFLDHPTARYGLGVFETVLVKDGAPVFYQEHLESIQKAAHALDLPACDQDILTQERSLLQGDGIWRWLITPTGTLSFFEPGIPPPPESFELRTSQLRVSSASWEARYKTMSYLLRLQAKREAGGQENSEAVLLNEHNIVASAGMANIFWARDGTIFTPTAASGCREGVVRRWVLEKSGVPVQQVEARLEELLASDEIWLTNSRVGVVPATCIDSVEKKSGPIAQTLQKKYAGAI